MLGNVRCLKQTRYFPHAIWAIANSELRSRSCRATCQMEARDVCDIDNIDNIRYKSSNSIETGSSKNATSRSRAVVAENSRSGRSNSSNGIQAIWDHSNQAISNSNKHCKGKSGTIARLSGSRSRNSGAIYLIFIQLTLHRHERISCLASTSSSSTAKHPVKPSHSEKSYCRTCLSHYHSSLHFSSQSRLESYANTLRYRRIIHNAMSNAVRNTKMHVRVHGQDGGKAEMSQGGHDFLRETARYAIQEGRLTCQVAKGR